MRRPRAACGVRRSARPQNKTIVSVHSSRFIMPCRGEAKQTIGSVRSFLLPGILFNFPFHRIDARGRKTGSVDAGNKKSADTFFKYTPTSANNLFRNPLHLIIV